MKAIQIFTEFHSFVELVADYLDKKEKAKGGGSLSTHALHMAERNLKTEIAKFRATNQIKVPVKKFVSQRGFNFNHLGR